MRTPEEIEAMIDALKAKQAEITETSQDYLKQQTLPGFLDRPTPLWKSAERLAEWDKEFTRIDKQLEVLYWMTGKFEQVTLW